MLDYRALSKIPKHLIKIKIALLCFTLIPLSILILEFYHGNLGIEPLDRLTRLTGKTALTLLVLSLVITPLRYFLVISMVKLKANYGQRLSHWNWIIKLRRSLGLMAFFYAVLHFMIYFWLDQGGSLSNVLYDVKERNFIALGLLSLVMLIPLAITSPNKMMRLMGKKWRTLHRTVYLTVIISVAHFWMLSKLDVYDYAAYVLVIFLLLAWRVWNYLIASKGQFSDTGMEAVDREKVNRIIRNLSFLANKKFGEKEGQVMASLLFDALSAEDDHVEAVLKYKDRINIETKAGTASMVKRLKNIRKKNKIKIKSSSVSAIQKSHLSEDIDRIDVIDRLLRQGIVVEKQGYNMILDQIWQQIFATLLPTHSAQVK